MERLFWTDLTLTVEIFVGINYGKSNKKKKKKKKTISKSLEKKKTAILKKFKAFKGKDDPSNKRKH